MAIDWTLSVGNLLTIFAIMVTGMGFYWRQVYDGKQFRSDIIDIKQDLKVLNQLLIDTKLQNNRLDNQGRHINRLYEICNDLSKGRGFIREAIDGEYEKGHLP